MDKLTHHEVINLLIQLSVLLFAGRIMSELARKVHQPSVVGEILAGIILGPTILGQFLPEFSMDIFPMEGTNAIALDGFIQVALVLLLFIAGLEVDLGVVIRQGRQAISVSFFALIIPFGIGFLVTYLFPELLGNPDRDSHIIYALFIGTVLSITALPVVARLLMDQGIFKSPMGMLIIASAMVNDLLGWLIFSVLLTLMGTNTNSMTIWSTIGLTVGFTLITLTVGRWLMNRILPWINKNLSFPGGLLALSLSVCFSAAAFTEYIGIHAIFGAFIIGVALGDSEHLSERAKEIVHQFINNIFAPLFFVSIGLQINFLANFDGSLVIALIVVAFITKTAGAYIGANIGGLNKPQSLAVGFGMNTHGTLEIILCAIALQAGLITEIVFVAIVVMVLVTIIASAPLMRYSLAWDKRIREGS